MSLNFPSNPTDGQEYIDDNGKKWQFSEYSWKPFISSVTLFNERTDINTSNMTILDPNNNYDSEIQSPNKKLNSQEFHAGYIEGYKSYSLLKFTPNQSGLWVILYTDLESMKSDISRPFTQDPIPASGVISEFSSNSNQSIIITPTTIGFNADDVPSNKIYLKIVNISDSQLTSDYSLTLTILQMEK